MEIGAVQNNVNVLPAAPSTVTQDTPADHKDIVQAVKALSEAGLFGENNELTFALDRETRRPVLRIVDRKTNEVVRQIPAASVLQLAEDLKLLQG
jgi:uncharacterized FlaG/YvyC family protein